MRVMNTQEVANTGWTAFWSVMGSPGMLGLMLALAITVALGGLALNRVSRAWSILLRILSGFICLMLIISFANNLGLPVVAWLHAIINSILSAMRAPILL